MSTLLARAKAGDSEAVASLVKILYPELRRLAGKYMRGERPGHTLQPTALINEAYINIKLAQAGVMISKTEVTLWLRRRR
jgi:RNA polymerase sigma-70 factor, ECF subfamily